ncbi:Uncharacterized conserved protein [Pseudomonas syringae pv. actinidiae]|uniref:Uncharacterized conserved protein n=1 Tax=Pseudomonas syringae pv. actinidiae TaxID=103796 RepID=A0AAN4Q3T4_PSESF|nr:Uncharacterized conserved protein [Pseudomonas syringae pv. actinidiae]
MHKANLCRPLIHTRDEFDKFGLISVGRIAFGGVNCSANIETLVIQLDVSARRAMRLNGSARRSLPLITDKHHIMPRIAQHGFQVIDDPAAGTHAVTGDDNGRPRSAGQIVDRAQVLFMGVDGNELVKAEGLTSGVQPQAGTFVPVVFK